VNPNGQDGAMRGGDVVVAAELWPPGTPFVVRANTAEAAANADGVAFVGSHPVGSVLEVRRPNPDGPAFIEIRNVPPGEVVVLVKRP
jgi:hypothetical protein